MKPPRRRTCTNCGRRLLPAFVALSPVAVGGTVRLVPVCHPVCNSTWWKRGKS